jgi:hypothetical protein
VTSNGAGTVSINFGGVTGGAFTLTGGGRTTAPIAWNAAAPEVQAAGTPGFRTTEVTPSRSVRRPGHAGLSDPPAPAGGVFGLRR